MGTPIEHLQAIRRIRDYAVALSLAPTPPDLADSEQRIVQRQEAERVALESTLVNAKRSLTERVEQLACEIAALEAQTGGTEAGERLATLRTQRDALFQEIAAVHGVIRRSREAHEEKLTQEELQRLDSEQRDLLEQAAQSRIARHDARVAAWREGTTGRESQRQRLTAIHSRLQREHETAEQRMSAIRDPLVTRTVAGFLLWAGYSAVACTGTAVAYLLRSKSDPDVISSLAQSVFGLAGIMRDSLPPWLVLPASALVLISLLASVALCFVGCDKLIQYFDRNWRRRQPRDGSFSSMALGLPSPEIGRRAYVQTLAILPFAYIAGLGLFFMTYGGGNAQSATVLAGVAPAFLHTAIGSVVTLLAAAVFILYAIKIIEKRKQPPETRNVTRWWEMAIPPLLIVAAFGVAMSRPEPDRYVWGAMALFMVISSIGLAYGVVYRGTFRDSDELLRLLRNCERELEELDGEPEMETPDREERHISRQIHRWWQRRRQSILDEARRRRTKSRRLRPDGSSGTRETVLARWFGGAPQTSPHLMNDWRAIDDDAAPKETERRAALQQELSGVEQLIAEWTARAEKSDARARLDAATSELAAQTMELDGADDRGRAEMARLVERQAIELEEFRRAYEIGTMVRPAFETLRDRTGDAVTDAKQYWRKRERHV